MSTATAPKRGRVPRPRMHKPRGYPLPPRPRNNSENTATAH